MGKSPKILAVFREIRRVASKDLPVLISGESGTYKELVARAIHDSSPRQERPFIAVPLSSIPERLAAAELFGCEKGADGGPILPSAGQKPSDSPMPSLQLSDHRPVVEAVALSDRHSYFFQGFFTGGNRLIFPFYAWLFVVLSLLYL